jgi:hypothetical protein
MPFQMAVLVGIAITYTVVGGDNLAAFAASVAPSRPLLGSWAYYTMFGALQLLLSMVRRACSWPGQGSSLLWKISFVASTVPTGTRCIPAKIVGVRLHAYHCNLLLLHSCCCCCCPSAAQLQ